MKIIIGGALGRMGRELALAAEGAGVEVACGVVWPTRGQAAAFPIVTGYERIPADADVLIDFPGRTRCRSFCRRRSPAACPWCCAPRAIPMWS